MNVHHVRIKGSTLEHAYQITGTISSDVELMLTRTIDQFYDVTMNLVQRLGLSKVYSVNLDRRGGNNYSPGERLNLNPVNLTEWTVTHELSHALDAAYHWQLSQKMRERTGSGFRFKVLHYAHPGWKLFWYRVGSPPPPCGVDSKFNSLEDFAEALTAYMYPDAAKRKAQDRGYTYEKWGYTNFHDTPRGRFIQNLVECSDNKNALV